MLSNLQIVLCYEQDTDGYIALAIELYSILKVIRQIQYIA